MYLNSILHIYMGKKKVKELFLYRTIVETGKIEDNSKEFNSS